MSRTAKLKEARPDLYNDEAIRLFAEKADKLHDLKALYDTNGGKELVALLEQEVDNKVNKLSSQHQELNHQQMVAICAGIQACQDIIRLFKTAEKGIKNADEQLKEAMEE